MAVQDENGKYSRCRAVFTDITERKRAEDALRESERRYDAFLNSTTDLAFLKDEAFRYVMANKANQEFFGKTELEIIGKTDFELMPLIAAESCRQSDFEAVESEGTVIAEEEFRGRIFETKKFAVDLGNGQKGVGGLIRDITDRKRAEKALRESSSYNRSLIEASLDPLVTISAKGRITDVNTATERVTGYSRDELIGTDFADYFTDPQKAREGHQRAFNEGVVKDYDLEIRHRDGDLTAVMYNASVLRDSSGEIAGLFAAARDISDRRQAEEKNVQLAAIVESSDDAIIGKSMHGIITSWNQGAENIYGYKNTEAVGKPVSLLTPPDRQDEVPQFLERIKGGGHIRHYETVRRTKDGRDIDVSLTISPIRYTDGTIIGASTIARDITERKRMEEALRESDKHYRTLFEESLDGVYSVLRDGTMTDANSSFCELFGYTREEIIGKDVVELYLDPADRPKFQEEVEKKGFLKDYEVKLRKKDGTDVDCLLSSSVILEEDGSITGYRGFVRDLTARKALQRQLLQAQKMEAVGTLAGGIAHDFNNILQVVFGYSDLVLAQEDMSDRLKDDLGRVLSVVFP